MLRPRHEAAHYTQGNRGFNTLVVVKEQVSTGFFQRLDSRGQPFQSRSPKQIDIFQPIQHRRPVAD
jgi:hypothetical protein